VNIALSQKDLTVDLRKLTHSVAGAWDKQAPKTTNPQTRRQSSPDTPRIAIQLIRGALRPYPDNLVIVTTVDTFGPITR
jgi:hypothetical protein